jgi:hypothetical protein
VVVHRQTIPPILRDLQGSLSAQFVVMNVTDHPVSILAVRPSCSCMDAKLGSERLDPGQQTTLSFSANVRHLKGEVRVQCRLETDTEGCWTYEALATVYEGRSFSQPSLSFGPLPVGTAATKEIEFCCRAPLESALPSDIAFSTSGNRIQVIRGKSFVRHEAAEIFTRVYPLTVMVRPATNPGLDQGYIRATIGTGPEATACTLSVGWNVESLYDVRPTNMFFGPDVCAAGGEANRSVVIRRHDGRPLAVVAVEVPAPFAARAEPAPDGTGQRITVTVTPDRVRKASVWDEIVVTTDYSAQPVLRIPLALAKPNRAK